MKLKNILCLGLIFTAANLMTAAYAADSEASFEAASEAYTESGSESGMDAGGYNSIGYANYGPQDNRYVSTADNRGADQAPQHNFEPLIQTYHWGK